MSIYPFKDASYEAQYEAKTVFAGLAELAQEELDSKLALCSFSALPVRMLMHQESHGIF